MWENEYLRWLFVNAWINSFVLSFFSREIFIFEYFMTVWNYACSELWGIGSTETILKFLYIQVFANIGLFVHMRTVCISFHFKNISEIALMQNQIIQYIKPSTVKIIWQTRCKIHALLIVYYQILSNSQLLHLEHGGRVSVESSNTFPLPHFLQTYVPFPGLSPHLYVNFLPPSKNIFNN